MIKLLLTLLGITAMAEQVTLDNGYNVWTKRVGHGPIKILTLHGGPGCNHVYIENAFEKQFSPDVFEIIYYDQLGSYNSDQPDDDSLWTVERFREEVEQVRKALGLEEFYLYGQSWGGMLAIEYALKYPEHLKGMILSNTPPSIKSYEAYVAQLRAKLPADVLEKMLKFEAAGDLLNPDYQKLVVEQLYTKHLCRLDPWPEEINFIFETINPKPYITMQGPNEFVITGNFKDWDHWSDFSKITVPTLVISGLYDTINPADTIKIASLMQNGAYKICQRGSHLCMFDDAENYFHSLREFLYLAELKNERNLYRL